MQFNTPVITPAQIVAFVAAIVAQFVTFGLLSGRTAHLIVGLAGIIVPFGLLIADAIIRHGRSRAMIPPVNVSAQASPTQAPPA